MRIKDLPVTTEAEQTDFLAVDDSTLGTRRISPDDLIGGMMSGYVSYGIDTVTTEQQANARSNIGIGIATTESEGLVQLYNGVDSTSTTMAATAAAVKQAYEHGGGGGSGPITIYTSVTDLSLTSGSATISGIWSAMSAKTMLICGVSEIASSERPFTTAAGILQVYKELSTSGFIEIHGKKGADGDYRMFLSDYGVPTGTWIEMASDVKTGTITKSTGVIVDSDTRFVTSLVRYGKLVVFQCALELSSGYFSPNYTTICTLPSGFCPANRFMGPAVIGTSVWGYNSKAKYYIQEDGTVQVYASAVTASGEAANCNRVQFSAVFIAG